MNQPTFKSNFDNETDPYNPEKDRIKRLMAGQTPSKAKDEVETFFEETFELPNDSASNSDQIHDAESVTETLDNQNKSLNRAKRTVIQSNQDKALILNLKQNMASMDSIDSLEVSRIDATENRVINTLSTENYFQT